MLQILFSVLLAMAGKNDGMFLYHHGEKVPGVEVKDTTHLLKNRIYMKHIKEFNMWAYVMTNQRGKLANPPEVIGENSVVSGQVIGAKNMNQNFKLNSKGVWVPSNETEHYTFWTASVPTQYRTEYLEGTRAYAKR